MAVEIAGLTLTILLYITVVVIGIIAAKKFVADGSSSTFEIAIVAGRKLGYFVGIMTTAATFVGGGFINGTAEGVADFGLVWSIAPFAIFLGTSLGGVIFAPIMRKRNYLTMLDPLQEKYGNLMTGALFCVAILADLLWAASILGALGTTLSVIIGLETGISVIVSAVVALVYTMFGQLVSVAYTDIFQLFLMVFGLIITIPFGLTDSRVTPITNTTELWLGSVDKGHVAFYVDFVIVQIFASIPWQTYFQRLLSAKNTTQACVMAFIGGFSALVLGIPPILIGSIGVSADWNATDLGYSPVENGEAAKILPYVLRYLTPEPVAIIGLSAVVAAVMSSLDSIILSSSSMFSYNIYRIAIRNSKAKDSELLVVQRVAMFIAAAVATVLALSISSIYYLFYLAADFVFMIMLPQLTCAVFVKGVNAVGSFVGFALGIIIRLGAGDIALGIKPIIKFPLFTEEEGQIFPYKTPTMLLSLVAIIIFSYISSFIGKLIQTAKHTREGDVVLEKYTVNEMNSRQVLTSTTKDTSIDHM